MPYHVIGVPNRSHSVRQETDELLSVSAQLVGEMDVLLKRARDLLAEQKALVQTLKNNRHRAGRETLTAG